MRFGIAGKRDEGKKRSETVLLIRTRMRWGAKQGNTSTEFVIGQEEGSLGKCVILTRMRWGTKQGNKT